MVLPRKFATRKVTVKLLIVGSGEEVKDDILKKNDSKLLPVKHAQKSFRHGAVT